MATPNACLNHVPRSRKETTLYKVVLDERPLLFTFTKRFRICFETLNGRLPLKHGSDRPQTLAKRVSDDLQHFIVRRRKKKCRESSEMHFGEVLWRSEPCLRGKQPLNPRENQVFDLSLSAH